MTTRHNEKKSRSASSPLRSTEKQAILREEYWPTAHRIGLITSLIHVIIFFLPPTYLMVFYGLTADWGTIMQGAAATWSFSMPLWLIEPISYFVVLGVCGTYISFLAGNISNFRLPVSAVAQEVAQVQEGSPEGEIISTLAITATQVMITVSALTGAMFVSAIVSLLPLSVVASFNWLLPSIWGAIVVQFGLRNWRYAVVFAWLTRRFCATWHKDGLRALKSHWFRGFNRVVDTICDRSSGRWRIRYEQCSAVVAEDAIKSRLSAE